MAEVDVSQELYKEIKAKYDSAVKSDSQIKSIGSKLKRGRATPGDIAKLAERVGEHASDALKSVLTVERLPDGIMYWNIAEKTIQPLLTDVYDSINAMAIVQQRQNDISRSINIGISKGTAPKDRIETVMGFATNSRTPEELANALDIPVKTTALDYVDDFEKRNAEVRNDLGFVQYVVREYDGVGLHDGKVPCEWCISRSGTFEYQDAIDKGVFERHNGCGCTIEVITKDDLNNMPDDDVPELPF